MQINTINTFNNSRCNNNGQKSNPSFGKFLPPDFTDMAVNEIKALTNTSEVLIKMFDKVNVLISKGTTLIEHGRGGMGASTWQEYRPVDSYKFNFSELGSENKTIWQKIKAIFKKENAFSTVSEPTVFGPKDETKSVHELEEIVFNGAVNGLKKYRETCGLNKGDAIKEAQAKLAEIQKPTIQINSVKGNKRK